MKEELIKLIKEHPFTYVSIIKSKRGKKLLAWINKQTKVLSDPFYTIKTKIYWILNDIISFDDERCKCKQCHRPLVDKNIDTLSVGYRFCSPKCARNNPEINKRIENTVLKKYGATNYFKSELGEEVKEKSRQTRLKKIWC